MKYITGSTNHLIATNPHAIDNNAALYVTATGGSVAIYDYKILIEKDYHGM